MTCTLVHSLNLSSVDTVHRPTVHSTFWLTPLPVYECGCSCSNANLLRDLLHLCIFRQSAVLQRITIYSTFNFCKWLWIRYTLPFQCDWRETCVEKLFKLAQAGKASPISISPKESIILDTCCIFISS